MRCTKEATPSLPCPELVGAARIPKRCCRPSPPIFVAYLRKIVGEDEGRTGAIGAMHDGDRLVGQLEIAIDAGDPGIVPFCRFSEVDVRQDAPGQLHLQADASMLPPARRHPYHRKLQ